MGIKVEYTSSAEFPLFPFGPVGHKLQPKLFIKKISKIAYRPKERADLLFEVFKINFAIFLI
jgi:hypothetical protein